MSITKRYDVLVERVETRRIVVPVRAASAALAKSKAIEVAADTDFGDVSPDPFPNYRPTVVRVSRDGPSVHSRSNGIED